jgi:NAD(P)H-hydrate repair Nnr-like enzyme with NAD(P)H-hydrate dehydratase domain
VIAGSQKYPGAARLCSAAAAIGPRLGRESDEMVRAFLSKCRVPCVIDADALSAIS